ncbi:ABC transporter permease, partial [Candidatus Blastococcus massiliensis]|uniref:ABC transporter permease n=1 Tax=Candidatus Blastococcus massiliensis TaxID=1470358 RepID=UPI0012DD39D3
VERPLGAAPRRSAAVPWELALVLAAGLCWLLLESRDAIVIERGVAQVNGLLVAFPVLGVAGAALLGARLATRALPALRRWAGRRRPPVFLAVNRLAAAPGAAAALLVAVTVPVAVLGYTATLSAGSETTLAAKVGVQIGAERALVSIDRVSPTAGTDAVGTVLDRYDGSVAGPADGARTRTDVQVLAVDPDTFAGTAFWDGSFADVPLEDLVARLTGPPVDGRIPVVATGLPPGAVDLRLGSLPVDAEVAGTARVLPGRRTAEPVVLVAADRLPDVPRSAGSDRQSELWTDGPAGPAVEALTDAGGRLTRTLEPADVLTTANFLGISWTFGYLSALAVFVGVIAAAGLLLHLESRSRSRVAGYVMARRLGLSRRSHLASLVVELGAVAVAGLVLGALLAVGAVALVHRRLDVDLLRPPTPLLDVPWAAIGLTVAVALLLSVLTARYAQAAADRADPSAVLREEA